MKNVFLEKIEESELQKIQGGALKCSRKMPDYIRKGGRSSAYFAWVNAYCTTVPSCSPSTWNHCY